MQCKRILVPIHGIDRIHQDAIRLSCQLAKKKKGKIFATYVMEIDRSLPLEAEVSDQIACAEDILDAAEKVAEDCDYEIKTDLLQARQAGPAVVNEAVSRKVDMIIVGLPYKMLFGEFSMGEIIPYVLKHAHCEVMVLREAIS